MHERVTALRRCAKAIGPAGLIAFGEVRTQCVDLIERHLLGEFHLIERVPVALEQSDFVPRQAQHLVAVGRLNDAQQRRKIRVHAG